MELVKFIGKILNGKLYSFCAMLGLIHLRICFLKAITDSEFRILLSSILHSIRVDGKKRLQRYSCLTLNKRMLLWLLEVPVDKILEIISKR